MRYFEAFPVINYNDISVKNILLRVKLLESAKSVRSVYHPFTLREGESPQKIAYDYYGSTEYAWLIFLVNNIVDPYYDWPLSTVEFENHIKKKYGSLAAAQEEILYYQKKPVQFYISIADPSEYILADGFEGDTSGYNLITRTDIDIKISPESYAANPDAAFTPVDAYTFEEIANENKRNIRLLDKTYARIMDTELKNLLSPT
jgi:hypothetical protein